MTVHVPFDLACELHVRADADTVYAVLADVLRSASRTPAATALPLGLPPTPNLHATGARPR